MHTREQHLAMMANPGRWPCWPFLPLVRVRGGGWPPDQGLLWAGSGLTVHLCNLLMIPKSVEEFRALPSLTYGSLEEILNDGWEVD